MGETMVSVIMFITTCLFIGFGYLIGYQGRLDLINGYRPGKYKDEQGLGQWLGSHWLFIGGLGLLCWIIGVAVPSFRLTFFHVFWVTIVLVLIRFQWGVKRFR